MLLRANWVENWLYSIVVCDDHLKYSEQKMKDKEEYLRSINIIKNGVLQKNRDIVVWLPLLVSKKLLKSDSNLNEFNGVYWK